MRPALVAILEAVAGIEEATAGLTLEDYRTSWLLRRGVERGIEIISEASRRIPDEVKATQPDIRWDEIAGIGNVLRHEYHRISDIIVWRVAVEHLAGLKQVVLEILGDLGPE